MLDACGLTEQENTDDERIAVEADQRDDAWIAHGGESDMPDDPTATAYHTAFAGKVAALLHAGIAPWQTPWTPGRVRVPVTRITTRRTPRAAVDQGVDRWDGERRRRRVTGRRGTRRTITQSLPAS